MMFEYLKQKKFFNERTRLLIKAKNKKNDILTLNFHLINTNLVTRWANLVNKNLELNKKLFFDYNKILSEDEIDKYFIELKTTIANINYYYDRELKQVDTVENLKNNFNILNDLHEEFELYGDRCENNNSLYNVRLDEDFLKLNNLIHRFETIFRSSNTTCTCLFNFRPSDIHENLKDEDYFLFTQHLEWGVLYLGYDTLGKNWYNSALDEDTEVVLRKKIMSQKRFAAESFLSFNVDRRFSFYSNVHFYNWWKKNNFSKDNDPNFTLKEFAFGYAPLAVLTSYQINQNEKINFLPIDLTLDEKFIWSKNVWSKFDEIIKFELIQPGSVNLNIAMYAKN
jgi:hypothetical protein